MIKRYQIFISSTFEDLKQEREIVQRAILSEYNIPVGMEFFGAVDSDQWEVIKDTIDTSDYYVLIIARSYGTIIPDGLDKGISYTEKEYLYAVQLGIPVLAFILDKDAQPERPFDTDEEKKKGLERFIQSVETHRTVAFWKNGDELAWKINAAITRAINENPMPGWVRAEHSTPEKIETEAGEMVVDMSAAERTQDNEVAEPQGIQRSLDKKGKKEGQTNQSTIQDAIPQIDEAAMSSNRKFFDAVISLKSDFTIKDISAVTGLSMMTVKRLVEKYVQKGKIEKIQVGKHTAYYYNGFDEISDGSHIIRDKKQRVLREGIWKDGKLYQGREHNYLIKDVDGKLVYNPDDDDYGSREDDIDIEETMPYYDDRYSLIWVMPYIEHEGLDDYYICDIAIDRSKAKGYECEYYNIHKFEEWLKKNDPETLKKILAAIELARDE